MSTASLDSVRPPRVPSATYGTPSMPGLTSTTTTTTTPPLRGILKSPSHASQTPTSPPAFTPTAASVGAALWALRGSSGTPSAAAPRGASLPSAASAPRIAGVMPTAQQPTSPPPVVAPAPAAATTPRAAVLSTSEDILRGIYNEKLHASVRSIIATLTTELPEDHLFLQLLADPTTQQYCKVRLTEVVEGFLYSTQAEQYHELAMELARREQDCETQRQRIDELEAALAALLAEAQQQQQQQQQQWGRESSSDTAPSSAVSPAPAVSHTVTHAAPAPATPPASATNPMDDEEARRELLRILEQATHDHELSRCQEALQAVTQVAALTAAPPVHDDTLRYEGEVVDQLYGCVHALLHYVDGALESQERLRRELQVQHPWLHHSGIDEGTAVAAAGVVRGGGAGHLVSSSYSTPRRPDAAERSRSPGTGEGSSSSGLRTTTDSHLSAAAAQSDRMGGAQGIPYLSEAVRGGVGDIQRRRAELRHLLGRLQAGQQQSRRLLERLAEEKRRHETHMATLQQEVETARSEARAAAAEREVQHEREREAGARATASASAAAAAAAAERAKLRDELADLHAKLAAVTQDLDAAQRELTAASGRADDAEQRAGRLSKELASATAALRKAEAQLREKAGELDSCQAAWSASKAACETHVEALQDAARELLCLRVEKTMAGLSAAYQESKAVKADLLERHGYRPACGGLRAQVAVQQEATRHAEAQLRLARAAESEAAQSQQGAAELLGTLLRSLWTDNATEAVLGAGPAVPETRDDGTAAAPTTAEAAAHATRVGRDAAAEDEKREGAPGDAAAAETEPAPSTLTHAQRCRLPTTLVGLCHALEHAYASLRARHRARQSTIESLRTTLIGKDIELRAAEATEAQLRELLRAERAKEEQWRLEMAQLHDNNNPMRDLLARQEALLKAVSEERNALRKQWNSLSSEYIALEQRNGVLHERCANKEHENARLSGMLRRCATASNPTPAVAPAAAEASTVEPVVHSVSSAAAPARSFPVVSAQKKGGVTDSGKLSFSANTSQS